MITKLQLAYVHGTRSQNIVQQDGTIPVMVFPNATERLARLAVLSKSKIFSDLVLVGNNGIGTFQWAKLYKYAVHDRSGLYLDPCFQRQARLIGLDGWDMLSICGRLSRYNEYNRIVCITVVSHLNKLGCFMTTCTTLQ